ncbi:MFS transporter [Haloechinothrix halophila]|uniref:MFS transporter n=1 Tax=Haloechinothrix halophila TaxID=1069073 RepID=UPI00041EBA90|nr:MFS transporter [Haloechinothrix halophila]
MGAALLDVAVSPLFIWSTFTETLAAELAVAEPSLSVVFAVGLALFTTGVLLGGRLADAVAPRVLAVVTAAGVVAGLMLCAVASSVPVLLIGFGVVLGLTTGVGYGTAVRVAGTVDDPGGPAGAGGHGRRGRAVALVVSAYAAGAVILAPIAAWLLAAAGRAGTFLVLAGLLGLALLGSAALLPGAGAAATATDPTATGGGTSDSTARATRGVPSDPGVAAAVPRRAVLALWVLFSLGSLPALVAFAHAGAFAGDPALVVAAVALLNAGNVLGRLAAGPLADIAGYPATLHGTAFLLLAALIALVPQDVPALALSALFALGAQYGALSVLTPVATADTVPAARFGTSYGMVFSGWGVAGLAGPVAAAALVTQAGQQVLIAALAGVAVLAWGATVWVTRDRRVPAS